MNKNGQSLVEILLALAVTVTVILALVRVSVRSLKNANFAKNKALATKYAQEWIEEARELRDEDSQTFFSGGSPCNKSESIGIFTRTRTCTLNGQTMNIVVKVSWTNTSGTHQTKLETNLTNWQ